MRYINNLKQNKMQDYIKIYSNWETKDLFDQLYFLEEQTYTTLNHYRVVAIKSILKSR